jgi:subtilisin
VKYIKSLVLLVAAALGVTAVAAPRVADAEPLTYLYEVAVEDGVNPASHAAMFLEDIGIDPEQQAGRLKHIYPNLVGGYAVELTYEEAAKADRIVLSDGDIVAFNRSFEMEAAPIAPAGVGALTEQVEPLALQRMGMPATVAPSARPVVVVMDTGVDPEHPDLNVLPGFNAFEPGASMEDVVGHGTFVASLAAAVDDADGIRGSAPGADIVPIKIAGDIGTASSADMIAGLEYVAGLVLSGQRVDAVNISFGGGNPQTECGTGEDLWHEAICALINQFDVAVVVSAGNSSGPSENQSPANYPEVVTVSAFADYDGVAGALTDTPRVPCTAGSVDDGFAEFSSYGEVVDITAVGVCNIGASPTNWGTPQAPYVPYGSGSGTSFSSPLVAGALARYRANCPVEPVRVAVDQLLRYSALHGGVVSDDPDGVAEPVLWLGDIPCVGDK